MIFVAVGTQFSFNRLIHYMDEWGAENDEEVVAQISDGDYLPKNIEWHRFLDSEQYNQYIEDSSVFVSHAGMGNIISAREKHTPIIVMNRQFSLGEHRNDHQAEGLKWMDKLNGVYVAPNKETLFEHLSNTNKLSLSADVGPVGNEILSNHIADFILNKH